MSAGLNLATGTFRRFSSLITMSAVRSSASVATSTGLLSVTGQSCTES